MPPTSKSPLSCITAQRDGGRTVASSGERTILACAEAEEPAVRRAVEDLANDLHRVCGAQAVLSSTDGNAHIIAGTIGRSPLIDAAIEAGRLDVSPLRDEDGNLRWESFLITMVDEVLYLVGADRRGTIYAIYHFAEEMGVSPWYWWADVPVRTRDHITVANSTVIIDWPSVQYRGVFINDEEELGAWAREHTSDGTIGPETYRRVYELILRLKGNYLWPAMHVGAFNHDPENGRLAEEMGVVIGTSHCDMLLRSNEHEFRPWVSEQDEPVEYDYSLTGRNRDKLLQYWQGSVEQNRDYEVTWTVGMRGVHDTGFRTAAIDSDEALSLDEKFDARVRLLEQIIADQRQLLGETLGARAATAPQIFIPYKEVLPFYNAGLKIPDDVTLVWTNDNYGYIRRFPSETERERAGGNGLYYHSSYWADMSTSYLATSSTPLALMKSELRKAWDRGIRKLWVDNIGSIKPLEQEMTFFLRSAWEAGKETTTAAVEEFTARWLDATFTGGHGDRAAQIYATYYQVNNQRKLEMLTAEAFAPVGYGDEAGRRLELLRSLYERTNDILAALPADERDAFFQLFAVKIHLSYLANAQFVHADRSNLASEQGKFPAADRHLEISRTFEEHKRALIHFYNQVMAGGRWNRMFTPEEFPPPVMALYPAASPSLTIGPPRLGVVAWGDRRPASSPRLTFWPHGLASKWIEIFTAGAPAISYTVQTDPWIEVDRSSGTTDAETRVTVRVLDPVAHAGQTGTLRIYSPTTGERITVEVAVASAPRLESNFVGAIEADGYVCVDPARPDLTTTGQTTRWEAIPLLGRYGNAAMQAHGSATNDSTSNVAAEATLQFRFHLVTPGAHLAEIHRLPTLNALGRIRLAVSIDGATPIVVESSTTDEHRGAWLEGVYDNVERLRVRLPLLEPGPHTLNVHVVDRDVTVSKVVIYTSEPAAGSLGPEFSRHTQQPMLDIADPDPLQLNLTELNRVAEVVYRTHPGEVPLPRQVYAGRGFWDQDTTFVRPIMVDQPALGTPRSTVAAGRSKDTLSHLGSGPIIETAGVIAIEAEYVLEQSAEACTTPSVGGDPAVWTHTQAETRGRSGLAMHVTGPGMQWDDPAESPGLHYAIDVTSAGIYHVWLLVKFDSGDDDACVLALDGVVQPPSAQFCGGEMCTYGIRQVWLWALLSDLEISAGRHTLSVLARKSRLRIARIYLSTGNELPPIDAHWVSSRRARKQLDEQPDAVLLESRS